MGCYVVNNLLGAYTLQEDTTCVEKISMANKLVVKDQYLNCMKENAKCYWGGTY